MKRTRSLLAAAASLAIASATALLPALTTATPASATPSCGGTSLVTGLSLKPMRIPTVGNATPNQWACLLGPGNAGSAVSRLQIDLNDCHNAHLTVDGIYGPNTAAAVRVVQAIEGVPQDGIYGPMTIHGGRGGPFTYQLQNYPAGVCDTLVAS